MAEFEAGPNSLPNVVVEGIRTIVRINKPLGSLDEYGIFPMGNLYLWAGRLLNFDPNQFRIVKSNDTTGLYIVNEALSSRQAQSYIAFISGEDYDKFHIFAPELRIVDQNSSGLCEVDDRGRLHFITDEQAHLTTPVLVERRLAGEKVYLVIFDKIPFMYRDSESIYTTKDGIVVHKDSKTGIRQQVPRLISEFF